METLAKSDAFFFITSIAVILLALMALVILFYGIRLARTAMIISRKIRTESDNISNDIAAIRAKVSEEGFGIKMLFKILSGFLGGSLGRKGRAGAKGGSKKRPSGGGGESED